MKTGKHGGERKKKKIDVFFFFNDTATTEIYTLSLHDALPISSECEANAYCLDNIRVVIDNEDFHSYQVPFRSAAGLAE